MTDLNKAGVVTNLSGSGFSSLNFASAINDEGQIVGLGTKGADRYRGLLATPRPRQSRRHLPGGHRPDGLAGLRLAETEVKER